MEALVLPKVWVADVLLPLAVPGTYTYRLPPETEGVDLTGHRVLVPLGARKQYAGLVVACRFDYSPAPQTTLRPVLEVLDDAPVVQGWQLPLWQWIAQYYLCNPGDVLRAALPVGLKLQSHLLAVPIADGGLVPPDQLSDKAQELLQQMTAIGGLTPDDAADALGLQQATRYLEELVQQGYAHLQAHVAPRYTAKHLRCLQLSPLVQDKAALEEAFLALSRAPKQVAVLMVLQDAWQRGPLPTERTVLEQAQATPAAVRSLLQKGLVVRVPVPVSRLQEVQHSAYVPPTQPTPVQAAALAAIAHSRQAHPHKPVLLHGVTGSGKTWVYTRLAQEVVAQGGQVLLLLPEIALTAQIVDRLRAAFGELLGVYHSRFSDAERVEIWQRVRDGGYRVVVGVRSAIWLPFDNLRLILVDEEHDGSLRQADTAPRFHARDVALYMGHSLQIPVVLGSATPALETWHQVQQGRYTLVPMGARAVPGARTVVQVVDMRHEVQHRLSHGRLSSPLMAALEATLARSEQAVLFVHRKGYAPSLNCTTCGTVPMCPNCDVALTLHRHHRQLRCHLCAYTQPEPHSCEACGQPTLQEVDYGTERVVELLQERYPKATIARMDAETTRGKTAHAQLINSFEAGDIDILVGTQMVTKGLDFPKLTLAAVLNADALLGYPDFRAHERAYQLLVQLMGRLGRAGRAGTFLVQTFRPEHPLLPLLQAPFETFAGWETAQRQALGYPPHSRLLLITLQHRDRLLVERHAQLLLLALQAVLGSHVRGPAVPAIERVRNRYRRHISVFLPRENSPSAAKDLIRQVLRDHLRLMPPQGIKIAIEVDA